MIYLRAVPEFLKHCVNLYFHFFYIFYLAETMSTSIIPILPILFGLLCVIGTNMKCGCSLSEDKTANCSSRINYECLSDLKPTGLILQKLNYTTLPAELLQYNFTSLEMLDLSYNNIKKIPVQYDKHFSNLILLQLSHNKFTDPNELRHVDSNLPVNVDSNPLICKCGFEKEIQELVKVSINFHSHFPLIYLTLPFYSEEDRK